MARTLLIMTAVLSPCAAQPGYIGAQACGGGPPRQLAARAGTGHARALSRGAEHPLAASFAPWAPGALPRLSFPALRSRRSRHRHARMLLLPLHRTGAHHRRWVRAYG